MCRMRRDVFHGGMSLFPHSGFGDNEAGTLPWAVRPSIPSRISPDTIPMWGFSCSLLVRLQCMPIQASIYNGEKSRKIVLTLKAELSIAAHNADYMACPLLQRSPPSLPIRNASSTLHEPRLDIHIHCAGCGFYCVSGGYDLPSSVPLTAPGAGVPRCKIHGPASLKERSGCTMERKSVSVRRACEQHDRFSAFSAFHSESGRQILA